MDAPAARPQLYLACWQQVPAQRLAEQVAGWGYGVHYDYSYETDELEDAVERLLALKPAAIVLSLAEMPGHTRGFALALRGNSAGRKLRLLIIEDNDAEQVEQTRRRCGFATFTPLDGLRAKLVELIGEPPPADKAPAAEARRLL